MKKEETLPDLRLGSRVWEAEKTQGGKWKQSEAAVSGGVWGGSNNNQQPGGVKKLERFCCKGVKGFVCFKIKKRDFEITRETREQRERRTLRKTQFIREREREMRVESVSTLSLSQVRRNMENLILILISVGVAK